MFYYLVSLVLIFYLPTITLAIECLKCDPSLKLSFSEVLNTTISQCHKIHKPSDMCISMLSVEFENKNASVTFDHLPEQTLIFLNTHQMTTNTITILFNKDITTQSFRSICTDSATCVDDMNKTYNMVKNFKYVELREKLRDRLYSVQLNVHNLTCSNNQGQTIFCPNGYCRLIRRDTSNVDRSCVSQGTSINPSGIIIESNTIEGSDAETMFIYACNKPMCNGVETDAQVKQLLEQYGMSTLPVTIPPVVIETTSIMTTITAPNTITSSKENSVTTSLPATISPAVIETTPITTNTTASNITTSSKGNSVMTTLHQTMIHFQWMLLLITTIILKM